MAVSHGIFQFLDGDFVVETSGGKYHARASVDELRFLLHSCPSSSMSLQDPTGHWYEAQLLHYGLVPSKSKGTAIMRLLDELNKGTLRVPKNILILEQLTRKEWYGEDSEEETLPNPAETQRNLAVNDSTQMQISADNLNFDFSMMTLKGKDAKGSGATIPPYKMGQYIFGSADPDHKSSQRTICPPTTANQSKHSHIPSSSDGEEIKSEARTERQGEGLVPPQTSSPNFLRLGLISGAYSISCSRIMEQRGSNQMSIILCLDTPRIWAAYDFGRYLGIFLLEQRPYRASNEPLPVQWRGRECGMGKMVPKHGDASWIAFLGSGQIEECLELDGDIGFWGSPIESASMSSPRCARSMVDEWESYAPEMYR